MGGQEPGERRQEWRSPRGSLVANTRRSPWTRNTWLDHAVGINVSRQAVAGNPGACCLRPRRHLFC